MGSASQPVYAATASGPDDDFAVFVDVGFWGCSGTLLAPNLVATARHCLAADPVSPKARCDQEGNQVDGPLFTTDVEPSTVRILTGAKAEGAATAHGAEFVTTRSNTICRGDLGFVILDQPLKGVPVASLRLGATAARTETLTLVGYGFGGKGRGRISGIELLDIGRSSVYDRPTTAPPESLLLPRSACAGDSGAPVLSDDTGAVVGIVSRTTQDCEVETSQTLAIQLAPYDDLLNRAFERAGAEPVLEGDDATSSRESSGCSLVPEGSSSRNPWTALLVAAAAAVLGRRRGKRALARRP
jgi:MYXO-CTERM domain-containing protein